VADMSWLFTSYGSKSTGKYFAGALQETIRQRGKTVSWVILLESKQIEIVLD